MKTSNLLAAALVTTSMVVVPMSASAAFYPADRTTYTCVTPTNCPGADHIVFNSFTNNPVVGDERPFFAGSLNGANVADRIKVKDGDEITVRMYVHNNADATKMNGQANTVAKNVKVKVIVPTASQKDANMVGFISADNANPGTVNDTMSVYGDSNFTVSYVAGSAKFAHAADGEHQTTVAVSDDIVKGGANLGNLNGCFAYSGYVTLKVKVNMSDKSVTSPSTPTTPQAPTTLVSVGAGNVAAIFAGVTAVAALAYSWVMRRQNAR